MAAKRSDALVEGLGLRERKKLDKLERVRGAAFKLFTRKGVDRTTTRDVAREAGIASGTLFLYARDKEDLICLVMHDELARAVEVGFATLPRGGALIDQLLHLFRTVLGVYGRHPELGAAFVRVQPGARGPNAEKVSALTFSFMGQMASLMRQHQAVGKLAADVDCLTLARSAFALYFSGLMAWLTGYATLEQALEPLVRESLTLLLRGLEPKPSRK